MHAMDARSPIARAFACGGVLFTVVALITGTPTKPPKSRKSQSVSDIQEAACADSSLLYGCETPPFFLVEDRTIATCDPAFHASSTGRVPLIGMAPQMLELPQ